MASELRRSLVSLLAFGLMGAAGDSLWSQDAEEETATAPATTSVDSEEPMSDESLSTVKSPLLTEPKTPEEVFEAMLFMVELGRPEVAKVYLKKFLNDNPPDDLLLKLRDKYGSAVFLKLANIADLRPLSTDLLDRNNAAFTKFSSDPARLQGFLKDLATGTSNQQAAARYQFKTAGVSVVPALIAGFENPAFVQSREILIDMLVRIGTPALPPLYASLDSPNPVVRHASFQAIGMIRSHDAIPYLLRFVGQADATEDRIAATKALSQIVGGLEKTRAENSNVATKLVQRSKNYLLNQEPWEVESDGLVTTWIWNSEGGVVQSRRLKPAQASLNAGLYFAKAALEVAPERPDVQSTYLNLLFAEEAANSGVTKNLKSGPGTTHDLAVSLGADAVSRTCAEALEMKQPEAALLGLQVLSKIGTVQQVRSVSGKSSTLQRALSYPDRRVQFAAARTIIQLDPNAKFPGSERIVSILGKALTQADATQPRALVIDAVTQRGQSLTGYLRDLGYEPSLARTGRDGFLTAASAQEIDIVLMDANVIRWGLSETLSNFRYDPRTMDLPIVIFGARSNELNLRVHLQQFPNTKFIEEPTAADDLREQMSGFLKSQTPTLTAQERSSKALDAGAMLAFLGTGQRRKLYDFTPIERQLIMAMDSDQLAPLVMPVIGSIPSVTAQERIALLAADADAPVALRSLAAKELASHVRQFGALTSKELVENLHAAWNSTSDPGLSTELAAVMGVLKPDSALVGQRLRARINSTANDSSSSPSAADSDSQAPVKSNPTPEDSGPTEKEDAVESPDNGN